MGGLKRPEQQQAPASERVTLLEVVVLVLILAIPLVLLVLVLLGLLQR